MKEPFTIGKKKFDLKFLLCGNSGSGKTHLCGTYTAGPVHFYMLDKGGEKTLEKLIEERPKSSPTLSVDILSEDDVNFSDFWEKLQQDNNDGFFDYMAQENGLIVVDSLTNANLKAIKEICKACNISPSGIGKKLDNKKGMSMPHWGQLLQWMQTCVGTIQELPCATATTVHLHTLMDKNQAVVARYPSVNGQFRQLISVDYDESYLLETRGLNHVLNFKERLKFEAKSRVFNIKDVKNFTMDMLATAYLNNDTYLKG